MALGGAVQAGHKYAKENGYDVDVQFDGDGQHDINYVSTLLQQIQQGSDIVVGSRFVKGHESKFRSSFMRSTDQFHSVTPHTHNKVNL